MIVGISSMALHDIGRTHGKRLNPAPNSSDKVSNRMAAGTTQNHNAGEEALSDGLKLKERQVLAVQDGQNKAIFGFYGTANKFGLRVAEDGVDVLIATDDQLIFNSEQNVFKIVYVGFINSAAASASNGGSGAGSDLQTVSYAHGLGYTPVVLAYFNVDGFFYPLPYSTFGALSNGFQAINYQPFSTDTTVSFDTSIEVYATGAASVSVSPAQIKYYLLQETAN